MKRTLQPATGPVRTSEMSLYEVMTCLAQSCTNGGFELLFDRIETHNTGANRIEVRL